MKNFCFKTLLLLSFLLIAQIGTSFHYHKDLNATTDHCSVCVLGHQVKQVAINFPVTPHQIELIEKNIVIPAKEVSSFSFQSTIRSRAPPSA